MDTRPFLGCGVGLRTAHYDRALEQGLNVDWIEVVSENFFGGGGRPAAVLDKLRSELPIVLHGVSMSVGSLEGPSDAYLRQLATLAERIEPAWISDHLCWGSFEGKRAHDLLPLPYTHEVLGHLSAQIHRVQEILGRTLVLENVSSYLRFRQSDMPEWEFLTELTRRTGCGLLIDLNNIVVSGANHGFDPETYLAAIPRESVWQFHLANHDLVRGARGSYRFDSHRGAVPKVVWDLYRSALHRFGAVSTSIEWDEDVPAWATLEAEQKKAKKVLNEQLAAASVPPPPSPTKIAPLSPTEEAAPVHLAQTQELLWRAITWPTGVRKFMQACAPSERELLTSMLDSSSDFSVEQRLDVYAEGYFARLFGLLSRVFPACAHTPRPGCVSQSLHRLHSRLPFPVRRPRALQR